MSGNNELAALAGIKLPRDRIQISEMKIYDFKHFLKKLNFSQILKIFNDN